MLYAIFGRDVDGSLPLRAQARPQHLQRLQHLREEGRLVIAGPHPRIDSTDPGPAGYSGSLIIAEFTNLMEAEIWAKADPYVTAGVFAEVSVKPFNKTLP